MVIEENTKEHYVIKQMDINSIGKEGGNAAVKEAKYLELYKHPNIIKYNEVYRTK